MNLQSGAGATLASPLFQFNRVGTWATETGYALCGDDATLQSYITGGCYDIDWGTPGNALPSDRDPSIYLAMPLSMRVVLIFLGAVLCIIVIAFLAALVYYRKKRLMKAAQPAMVAFLLVSGLFSAVRIFLAAVSLHTAGVCVADYWAGHLAFTGIIALCIKTLRVHIIVNMSGLKRVKITTTQVVTATAAINGVMILYLVIITGVSAPYEVQDERTAITGQHTYAWKCAPPNPVFDYILYAFEGLFLIFAAKLCYSTKDVPDAINETKIIALGT
jgi:hypothetical protein